MKELKTRLVLEVLKEEKTLNYNVPRKTNHLV